MKKLNQERNYVFTLFAIVSILTFSSCDQEDDAPLGVYEQDAILITNEGLFNTSNGSISFYNRSTGSVENNIFQKANDRILGDVAQHTSVHNNKAYLVVNNSNKIEVVNANTFKGLGVINGLALPRYFEALDDNKGYVTEWVSFAGNGRVAVVDLATLTVTKTIEVGALPEQLLISGNKLYVINSAGNTVSVINTTTDVVEANITVTNKPNSLVLDRNNNLWVLSGGTKVYNSDWTAIDEAASEAGALAKINITNNTVTNTIVFGNKASSPSKLTLNGDKSNLYYSYQGKIYELNINATSLNSTALINRDVYGLGVDPVTGQIYAGKAGDFRSDGWVVRFQPNGTKVDSFQVGIAPNGFVFR